MSLVQRDCTFVSVPCDVYTQVDRWVFIPMKVLVRLQVCSKVLEKGFAVRESHPIVYVHGYMDEQFTSPKSIERVVNRTHDKTHQLWFDIKTFVEFPVSLAGTVQ